MCIFTGYTLCVQQLLASWLPIYSITYLLLKTIAYRPGIQIRTPSVDLDGIAVQLHLSELHVVKCKRDACENQNTNTFASAT